MGKLRNDQAGFGAVEVLLIIGVLVIIGVVGYLVVSHNDKVKTPVSDLPPYALKADNLAVIAVYAQTADKMATAVAKGIAGATQYSKQSLPVQPVSVSHETNEVKKLYCFTIVNSTNLTEQVINGFDNDNSASWGEYQATSGSDHSLTKYDPTDYIATPTNPDQNQLAEALGPLIAKTGSVDISFATNSNASVPIVTSNPRYYPSGVAEADMSLPVQSNHCTAIAKQGFVDTTNKIILSITLDLSDSPSYSPPL